MAEKDLKTLRQAQGFHPSTSLRMKKGLFITFEGIEGCGKTTHAKLLRAYLKDKGHPCVYTREPGGTKLGEEVRGILLNTRRVNISDETELFLFEACRAEIVEEIIKPALEKKMIVICDRFTDATLSYQGYGGGIDLKTINTLNRLSTRGLMPGLTFLLDINTPEGLKRAKKKGIDRMESKTIAYHKRVRQGYLKLAKAEPGRIKVVKVDGPIDKVQAIIRKEADIAIQQYKRAG